MKKSVRRTIGGLLMASAIVTAAIPFPDAVAYDPATADSPSYVKLVTDGKINPVGIPQCTQDYVANGQAITVSKPSSGNWQMDWQFTYYADTAGSDGYIVKYNNQYQVENIDLKYRIYSDYVNFPSSEIANVYAVNPTTAMTTVNMYYGDDLHSTHNVHALNYQYVVDDPEVMDDAHTFFTSNFNEEFNDHKVKYDNWKNGVSPDKPDPISKSYADVYRTDKERQQFICNEIFGQGTLMGLTPVDKRVYKKNSDGTYTVDGNGNYMPINWESIYVPQLDSSEVTGSDTITVNGAPYKVDDNCFLASKFASLVGIAKNAFRDTKNVRTLTMDKEISYIGDNAFQNSLRNCVKSLYMVRVNSTSVH